MTRADACRHAPPPIPSVCCRRRFHHEIILPSSSFAKTTFNYWIQGSSCFELQNCFKVTSHLLYYFVAPYFRHYLYVNANSTRNLVSPFSMQDQLRYSSSSPSHRAIRVKSFGFSRHIRHYHLRQKVLHRKLSFPRGLNESHTSLPTSTFQSWIFSFQSCINAIINVNTFSMTWSVPVLSQKNKNLSSNQVSLPDKTLDKTLPSSSQVEKSQVNSHSHKLLSSNLPSSNQSNQFSFDQIEPFESHSHKLPSSNQFSYDQLETFCSSIDFIQLHRLNSKFNISRKSTIPLEIMVQKELSRFGHILYSTGAEVSHIHASNVFIPRSDAYSLPTVIDSGASKSLSPIREDFITFNPAKSSINGIGSKSTVEGTG